MTTKEYSILDDLHTTLDAVSGVEDVYGFDKPYKAPQGSARADRPFLNMGQPTVEVIESANSKTVKRLELPVEGIMDYDPERPSTSISAAHEMMGLVEAAVMADLRRGGYAISSEVTATSRPSAIEASSDPNRPGYLSFELTVSVTFGHSITDPSSD